MTPAADPQSPPAVAAALPPAGTIWRIDPTRSRLEFTGRHLMITTVKGRFAGVTGTIVFDGTDPAASSVVATIDAASIDTREPDRDAHLRSSELLDVAQHPQIVFRSRRVALLTGAGVRCQVAGDLTVRGVTREVVLDTSYLGLLEDTGGGARLAFSATSTINRKEFGAGWSTPLDAGGWLVGDELRVQLVIQAVEADAGGMRR